MADLSRNQNLRFTKPAPFVRKWVLDNSAAQHPYRGSPMMLDASEDTIYARVFDSNVTETTGDVFLGVSLGEVDVATTDTETDNVAEIAMLGIVGFVNNFSLTDADAGKAVYFSDEGTLTTTANSNFGPAGYIIGVEDGYVYVNINGTGPAVEG